MLIVAEVAKARKTGEAEVRTAALSQNPRLAFVFDLGRVRGLL
jgi:hypothetical protein